MIKKSFSGEERKRRHRRLRQKISGSPERPRLSVFRSNRHIYAQIILDTEGRTLVAASTMDPELRGSLPEGKTAAARAVGELLAKRALAKGLSRVAFDRGGYIYHGRIRALAEGAREAGLEF